MALCPRGHDSDTDDFCDECGAPMGAGTPASGGASAPPAPGSAAARPAGASPVAGGPDVAAPDVAAPVTAGPVAAGPVAAGPVAAGPDTANEVCPLCGTPRDGRFCEEDGHDFVLAAATGATPAVAAPGAPATAPAPAPPSTSGTSTSGTSTSGTSTSGTSTSGTSTPGAPSTPGSSGGIEGWVVVVDADRRYFDSVVARRGPDIGTVTFPTYYPRAEVTLDGAEVRIGRRRTGGSGTAPGVDLTGPPLDPGISRLHAVLLADGAGGWGVLDPGSTNGTTVNYGDDAIPADTVVPLRPGDRVHIGAYTTLLVERR